MNGGGILRPNFGFRTKLLLTYLACSLGVVFVAFVAGSWYINYLQKSNVAEALVLAQEQAGQVAQRVADIMKSSNGSSSSGTGKEISGLLEVNLRLNRTVTWAGYFDAEGNCIVERNSMGETIVRSPGANTGDAFKASVPTGSGSPAEVVVRARQHDRNGEPEHEIRQGVLRDGKSVGEVRFRVAESPIYRRIEKNSRQIAGTLLVGCGLLLAALLGIYGIIWRLFRRQIELVHRNERLDRMAYVGTLASGLAHEIRNPLSSMNVNLEVMREELADLSKDTLAHTPGESGASASRAADLAQRVQKEVRHLSATLTSFLDFALPSKEGMTEFSLRGLMEELLELHSEQIRQAEITVDFQAPSAHECVIEADRRLCHQAIRNVLINAIQVLAESIKRHLRIRIEVGDDHLTLTIADSGPGIPADQMETIFDAFVSGKKGGSGLGLAIARKIVEEHGGTIWAQNNQDTLGAVFTLTLPATRD